MTDKHVFAKGTPSLFIICSPFQALNAFEAIHKLEIKDYKFILWLQEGDPRNNQLFRLLQERGISYEIGHNKKYGRIWKLLRLLPKYNRYKRAFIGDYRNDNLYRIAYERISNNSCLIYLDDGGASISLLNGRRTPSQSNKLRFVRLFKSIRNVTFGRHVFTHYDGVNEVGFNVYTHHFETLSFTDNRKQKGVYIIGTNPERYAYAHDMDMNTIWAEMEKILQMIKRMHPNKTIIYVPHGRDTFPNMEEMCNKIGIIFKKANISVELLLLEMADSPETVYGFNSSALYSIKKMMPHTEVITLLYTRPYKLHDNYISIADYYQKNGIEVIDLQ